MPASRRALILFAIALPVTSGCSSDAIKQDAPGTIEVEAPEETIRIGNSFVVQTTMYGTFNTKAAASLSLHLGHLEYVKRDDVSAPAESETFDDFIARESVMWRGVSDEQIVTNWTFRCTSIGTNHGHFHAWWGDDLYAGALLETDSREDFDSTLSEVTTFDSDVVEFTVECVYEEHDVDSGGGEDSGTDGSDSDDDAAEDEVGVDDGTESETDTGLLPPEEIHLYPVSDLLATMRVLSYTEDGVTELPGLEVDVPESARQAAATYDGGGLYVGGDQVYAFARDRATGELSPVGEPMPRTWTVGTMRVSRIDDRLFVTDNHVMQTDMTQYAIGGDYGLAEGATFATDAYPGFPSTDPGGGVLYAPFGQNGGGLLTMGLGSVGEVPRLIDGAGPFYGAADVAVTEDGQCLYVASSQTLAFEIGADGVPTAVGEAVQGSARVMLPVDANYVVIARPGAEGHVEVRAVEDGCRLGEVTSMVDTPLGLHNYSNLIAYGDDSLVFEFNSGEVGRGLRVSPEGVVAVGEDFVLPDATRAVVVLAAE